MRSPSSPIGAWTVQKLTRKRHGTLRFTAAAPLNGRRTIEADVVEHGLPRARLVVARYRLPRLGPSAGAR